MINEDGLILGDLLKNWLEKRWYSSKFQQKLFGNLSSIEEFIKMTEGEINIRSNLGLVAPISMSNYPFEIYIEYTARPNGILIPKFSDKLKYSESIEKITEEEYIELSEEKLNNKLDWLAQHRKIRMQINYNREAIVN